MLNLAEMKIRKSTRRRHILSLGLLIIMIALGSTVWLSARQVDAAPNAPSLQLTKSTQGDITEVQSGEPFTYILAYNCASALENCEGAVISDVLPIEVDYISLTSNPAHVQSAAYDSGSRTITFTMIDPLPAGSTGLLQISVQFPPGTLPGTASSNTATFDATNAASVSSSAVNVGATGVFEMFAQKTLVGEAVVDFPVQFNLEICSPDSVGGVNMLAPTFVDQLPPDATFITAEGTEGVDWVYNAGAHSVSFINLPTAIVGSCLTRTITLQYSSDPSATQTNILTVTGTPEGCDGSTSPLPDYCNGITDPIDLGPVSLDFSLIPPYPEASGGKSSTSPSSFAGLPGELGAGVITDALPGELVTYTVTAQNTGYVTFTNAIVTDTIPSQFELVAFTIAPAFDSDISGFYELTSNPGVMVALPGNPYTSATTIDVITDLGLGSHDITALRWELGMLPPLSTEWSADVIGNIDTAEASGTSFANCIDFTADSDSGSQTVNNCNNVNVISERAIPRVIKSNSPGPYLPGEEVVFSLSIRNDNVAHLPYVDPILSDLLPPQLSFVPGSIQFISAPTGAPEPVATITNDYAAPGQTLLVWKWEGADSYALAPGEEITLEFSAVVIDFTPEGRYFNIATIDSNSSNPNILDCVGQPTEYQDVDDLDGDGDTTETVCTNPGNGGYVDIAIALSMDSEKFVRGGRDDHFQKLGLTYPGGEIDWKIVITNVSNITTTNIIVYDILPYIGDTGVIATGESRGSEWRPNLMSPVQAPVGIPLTVYYSQESNPCRPEVVSAAGCIDDWSTTFPDDPTSIKSLKFDFCDGSGCLELPIGDSLEMTWRMVAPNDSPTDASCEANLDPFDPVNHQLWAADNPSCPIAWNSFGFSAEGGGLTLLPSEPIRVGISANDSPLLSLGNFVWLDIAGIENDAIQQLAEQEQWGVNGIRVELRDTAGNPIDLDGDGDGEVDFRYTGPDHDDRPGYYLFGNVPAGNYVLRFFPPTNLTTSLPNIGADDALDSDGETAGTDPTYGDYLQTATISLSADDFTWDQGLWVATDYGDLPHDGINYTFPVTTTGATSPELAARHIIVPDLYLGAGVDSELDGQPSVNADGDDLNDTDDEDGIIFTTPIIPGQQACLNVTAVTTQTQAANLSAWFDFDGDGTLNGAGEQVMADIQPDSGTDLGGGVYEHCFTVPQSNHGGTLYSRFRLSTDISLTPEGTATDGEVEDYVLQLACAGNYIWDDDPDGGGLYNHVQDASESGIANINVNLIWGGSDGVIGTGSDDITYSTTTDANGEYHFCGLQPDPLNDGADEFQITIPSLPGSPSLADQNGNDALDSDGDVAGNGPIFTVALPIGTVDDAPNDAPGYEGYADGNDDLSFDFGFQLEYDWGDLPDNDAGSASGNYATNKTDGGEGVGPSHLIRTDLYLGSCVDGEEDGQPSAAGFANVDDTTNGALPTGSGSCTGNDDEDGIKLSTPLVANATACVEVTASTAIAQGALLSGWIDFNGNGTLTDSGEQILTNVAPNSGTDLGGGVYEHCFTVPADTANSGMLYSRFRLSTESGLTPNNSAKDGEVEDYAHRLACVGNYVFDDNDYDNTQSAGDTPIPGVGVGLLWGGSDGVIGTGGDDVAYTINTDVNGEYHFCGLPNDAADDAILDEYQISIPSLPSDAVTSDIGGDDSLDSDGDSNGLGPIFTIPLPNTEADDAANDNSYEGYPDNQDNLSFDFGFIVEYDWADLPDNNDGGGVDSYATDNGDNGEGTGPSHKITQDIYMGSCVDGENNGQPSAADSADQDDANSGISLVIGGTCVANDDEDGIEFVTPLIAGNLACINITATSAAAQAANLSGWIDFNGNGTLTDSGEAVLADVVAGSGTDLGGGVFEHCFTVPADTANSDTLYSRFRLSTDSGLSPFGAAGDGEVEDYAKQLACVGNYVFDDNDEDDTQSAGDLGIGNVTVNLVWGGKDGVIGTGSDDVTYATTTDANGEYHFCGLPSDANNDSTDDEYQLTAVNAPGISVTAGVGGDEALDSDGDIGGITTHVFSIPLPATLLDNASNDNSYEGYPDNQDDLTFDFGFVVDYDWGDLPDANSSASTSFPTTSADSGPHHLIVTDLYLGACVDGETDGQPDNQAGIGATGGDDNAVGAATGVCTDNDDEDGVALTTPLIPDNQACVTVSAHNSGADATLYGWIDFDGNGAFSAGEALTNGSGGSGGNFNAGMVTISGNVANATYCFQVPAAATFDGGETHMRFRITRDDLSGSATPWSGNANSGEVEDYWQPLVCAGNYLWMDGGTVAGVQDAGDSPVPDGTQVNLWWSGPDGDMSTTGDNVMYLTTTSSGIYSFCGLFTDPNGDSIADDYQIAVPVHPGTIIAADQGGDDALDSDGDSAGDGPLFTVPNPVTQVDNAGNDSDPDNYPDDNTDLTYDFGFVAYDWGDLPDASSSVSTSFPTTAANNGPRHMLVSDLYLGNCVDAELDGAPDPEAGMDGIDGDDGTAGTTTTGTCGTANDDEDGVTLITPMIAGQQACVSVTAANGTGAAAKLQGWIDFNGNGAIDSGEELTTGDFASGGGDIANGGVTNANLCFTVPAAATFDGGETYLRWRLSSNGGLTEVGAASDGEVEDYHQPLACLGNYVWHDFDNNGIQSASEDGINDVVVNMVWAGIDGDINTTGDNVTYSMTTMTNGADDGHYHFCGLLPGEVFQVNIPTPPATFTQATDLGEGTLTTDSDGTQVMAGAPVTGPTVTIPSVDYNTIPVLNWQSGEGSTGDSAGLENYPDTSTNVSIDFGFSAEATAVAMAGQSAQSTQPSVWMATPVVAGLALVWMLLKRREEDAA